MFLECEHCAARNILLLILPRLDGLVPNTPRVGSTSKVNGTNRKKFETPSMSRVKAEPASSPPDFKTPHKPGEYNPHGTPYVASQLSILS